MKGKREDIKRYIGIIERILKAVKVFLDYDVEQR